MRYWVKWRELACLLRVSPGSLCLQTRILSWGVWTHLLLWDEGLGSCLRGAGGAGEEECLSAPAACSFAEVRISGAVWPGSYRHLCWEIFVHPGVPQVAAAQPGLITRPARSLTASCEGGPSPPPSAVLVLGCLWAIFPPPPAWPCRIHRAAPAFNGLWIPQSKKPETPGDLPLPPSPAQPQDSSLLRPLPGAVGTPGSGGLTLALRGLLLAPWWNRPLPASVRRWRLHVPAASLRPRCLLCAAARSRPAELPYRATWHWM